MATTAIKEMQEQLAREAAEKLAREAAQKAAQEAAEAAAKEAAERAAREAAEAAARQAAAAAAQQAAATAAREAAEAAVKKAASSMTDSVAAAVKRLESTGGMSLAKKAAYAAVAGASGLALYCALTGKDPIQALEDLPAELEKTPGLAADLASGAAGAAGEALGTGLSAAGSAAFGDGWKTWVFGAALVGAGIWLLGQRMNRASVTVPRV
jgi:hypothetical protein